MSNWARLGNSYFQKRDVYEMQWEGVDLSKMMAVIAPFGGPIAVTRDPNKGRGGDKDITVYSSSGATLSTIEATESRIIKLGWTNQELLVIVTEDGTVRLYTFLGELTNQFSLGRDCKEERIFDVLIWPTGMVVLTGQNSLFIVPSFLDPRARRMPEVPIDSRPSSMAAVDPQYTQSKEVEIILGVNETIWVVDMIGAQDQALYAGPFILIAISQNSKFVASYTREGSVWVTSTDFLRNYAMFQTKAESPPKQMVWCGNDAIVLLWPGILILLSPSGEVQKYVYEDPCVLVAEIDGVRIVTNEKCELLQKVPDSVIEIFKIGSVTPAAMLYDALELFQKGDPKSDENLRSIKANINEAIESCLAAATYEFDLKIQSTLLRAASFGKSFSSDDYDPDAFHQTAMALRVINAMRHPNIGVPLTYPQYERLTASVVVDRLTSRRHHLLALRVCEFLNIKIERVLIHWACETVKYTVDESDEEVHNTISERLDQCSGISYREIATAAFRVGRVQLAKKLLDNEPRAADQVPLLIDMQDDKLALQKAVESADTDLINMAILHVKRKRPVTDFFVILRRQIVAKNLFVSYAKEQDPDLLKTFYLIERQPHKAGNTAALFAFRARTFLERVKLMEIAHEHYEKSEHGCAVYLNQTCKDQIELLKIQRELEQARGGAERFVDLSMTETLFQCFKHGDHAKAGKMKSLFRIPEKQWCWIKCRGLAHAGAWVELDKYCKSRSKPLLGYESFVEVCIEAGNLEEAQRYIIKVASPKKKGELFLKMGKLREAAEAAVEARDEDLINQLKDTARRNKDSATYGYIERLADSNGL